MVDHVDCIVTGAGVVGLAVARELAQSGREVMVLERHGAIGTETSSRNSEVVHAGIYYAPNSLKARLCVAGKHALYRYCAERGVPHERLGKLIVASAQSEHEILGHYRQRAAANGVGDLEWLDGAAIQEREPHITATKALFSPSTGIIDSHAYMLALLADFENAGGMLVTRAEVTAMAHSGTRFRLQINGDEDYEIECRELVNAAGLRAWDVAQLLRPAIPIPSRFHAIGHYYSLSGKSPFSHLIYPIPNNGGLGIHVTLDMAGQARFGPDVRWVDKLDYAFDDSRREQFKDAIRAYYPAIDDRQLQPAYTGIRPKLVGPGQAPADFLIQGAKDHGLDGLINLFGIESPGLTSSLALAALVANKLRDQCGTK